MNVFKSIGHFFLHLFGKQTLQDFANASKEVLKSAIGKIASEAVVEAEKTLAGADGGVKHKFAYDKIIADAKAQGIDVKDSIVHLLIELALQALVKHSFQVQ